MSDELNRCPFCSAEAKRSYAGADYIVFCPGCGASTDRYDTASEAIKAWNTRAERTCEVTEYNDCGPHAEDCTIVLSCGHRTLGYIPNYCPCCGAKVVS